jgi:hypothetical protein
MSVTFLSCYWSGGFEAARMSSKRVGWVKDKGIKITTLMWMWITSNKSEFQVKSL